MMMQPENGNYIHEIMDNEHFFKWKKNSLKSLLNDENKLIHFST